LAWDWALAGDDEPVPMAERPEVQAVFAATDPATLIAGWTRLMVDIAAPLAGLYPVLTVAGDGDPDVAAVQAATQRNRRQGARGGLTDGVGAGGGLRPDLSPDRAADIAAVLMDPLTVRRLVLDGGWTIEGCAALLDRMATAALAG